MSFRTLKARPKPNLDLTNKRRALTDGKVNEEIQSKKDGSSDGGTCLETASVIETNCGDNDEKTSVTPSSSSSLPANEDVTTASTKTSGISWTKLKPRPRPNLALGTRPNNANEMQRNSTKSKQDQEDCIIVAVSYTNDGSQENEITSSNSSVPVDSAQSTSSHNQQQQRNITAKLKARPKPNLISLNRNKRPLPPEQLKDSETCTSNAQVISTSEEDKKECDKLEKDSPDVQNNTITNNINSEVAKKENKRIVKKTPKKKRRKKHVELILGRKLRSLFRSVEFLEKMIAKTKKQITLQKTNKQVGDSANFRRKKVLIKNKIERIKMIKQKLKRSANSRIMKDGQLYNRLWRTVIMEIEKGKKRINKSRSKIRKHSILSKDTKEICLEKQKETVIELNKNKSVDGKETEKCKTEINDNIDSKESRAADLKEEKDIVSAEKKKKVHKIRCKINPMITKPSGVKSMRIKIFKDDGTCVKSASDMLTDKQSATQSNANQSSPSKDIKSLTNHSRRFNINTVKPNLATANRNYKPIQYTTSYGKLNNAVKQKFKDKFGSKKPPEHSKLTMLDLIFYNPSSNPMPEREKKKDESEISNEESKQSIKAEEKSVNEEKVTKTETAEENEKESSTAVDTSGLPVPQLKITADGKVIIAPESLIVAGKNDDAIKNESRPLIVENDLTHHKVFTKKTKLEKKVWSFQETLKFYKVLNDTGSDFLVMASHFPDRTRNCLKRKFKREEKLNGQLIDKVIGSRRIDFSEVEKELALNQMWDEVEKSCKRRSKFMPEIPDVNKGNICEMFLTKREREMKVSNGDDTNGGNAAVTNEYNEPSKQIKQERVRKPQKKKKKPKVLRLKEYLSDNTNGNIKKTFQINLKCLEEAESTNVSSDEEETKQEKQDSIPIVVNTRIESSGIRYTKSVTFNPGNMDLPVDVNETIAHTGDGDQECPSSTDIIKEIVHILSTDEKPSILCKDEKPATSAEDVSDSDQSICIE